MSDGGRPGFDAPYMPRGCDLKFYSTREICQILTRFESIIFLGDSLVRHLLGAFSILLRENLEYGAQQQWRDELYAIRFLPLFTPYHQHAQGGSSKLTSGQRSNLKCPPGLHLRQTILPLPLPRHRRHVYEICLRERPWERSVSNA